MYKHQGINFAPTLNTVSVHKFDMLMSKLISNCINYFAAILEGFEYGFDNGFLIDIL